MARPSKYREHRDDVLVLVYTAAARHAPSPTVRALAEEVNVGLATMHSYLGKLAEEGLIEWQHNRHRSLRLTPQGFQHLQSAAAPQP